MQEFTLQKNELILVLDSQILKFQPPQLIKFQNIKIINQLMLCLIFLVNIIAISTQYATKITLDFKLSSYSLAQVQNDNFEYPFNEENLNFIKMSQRLNKMNPYFKEKILKLAIVDNNAYLYSQHKQLEISGKIKAIVLQSIKKKLIPNLFLYIYLSKQDQTIIDSQAKDIPFFTLLQNSQVFKKSLNQNEQTIQKMATILSKYGTLQKMHLNRKQKISIQKSIDIVQIIKEREELKDYSGLSEKEFQSWFRNINLISLQETVEEFSFIKRNLDPFILAQMFSKVNCGADMVNFIIIDNQVFAGGELHYHDRVITIANFIRQIIKEKSLPDMYFLLHINDELNVKRIPNSEDHQPCRQMPLFLMNKNSSSYLQQTKFLFPDPYIIKNWSEGIKQIKQESQRYPWQHKIKKAFFRGLASGPNFYDIPINNQTDFFQYFHRAALIKMSHDHPNLIQARFTPEKFQFMQKFLNETLRRYGPENVVAQKVSEGFYCKYRYALSPDGFGAPWRRIPGILFSNSIMIRPYSQKLQWFYDKMVPGKHFVQTKVDLSDLLSQIKEMNGDDKKALSIISQANKLAQKYLTPKAIKQFAYQTLLKYSQIQKLKLSKQSKLRIKNCKKQFNTIFLQIKGKTQSSCKDNQGYQSYFLSLVSNLKANLSSILTKQLILGLGCGLILIILMLLLKKKKKDMKIKKFGLAQEEIEINQQNTIIEEDTKNEI